MVHLILGKTHLIFNLERVRMAIGALLEYWLTQDTYYWFLDHG